jgi:hypothetical protein
MNNKQTKEKTMKKMIATVLTVLTLSVTMISTSEATMYYWKPDIWGGGTFYYCDDWRGNCY